MHSILILKQETRGGEGEREERGREGGKGKGGRENALKILGEGR